MTAIGVSLRGVEINAVARVEDMFFRLIVYREDALEDVDELGAVMAVFLNLPTMAERKFGEIGVEAFIRRAE